MSSKIPFSPQRPIHTTTSNGALYRQRQHTRHTYSAKFIDKGKQNRMRKVYLSQEKDHGQNKYNQTLWEKYEIVDHEEK